jgi:hypothetical protein
VPVATVPDPLRSGVTTPCRYEPGVPRVYAELAAPYGTTILPARPGKLRDQAQAEGAVQVASGESSPGSGTRPSLSARAAMNARIAAFLKALNATPMRHDGGASRRDLFERLDRPALRPLPAVPFEYAEWKGVRVNLDYHVEIDHHNYSVPHTLLHERRAAPGAPRPASSSSTAASGARPTPGVSCAASRPPRPRTCPRPTRR